MIGLTNEPAQSDGIRRIRATRYLSPLREGGSLPAIVEADDQDLYVMKFAGAGQGPKALIAELIAGEIGRALGLRVPEIVLIELDGALASAEPNQEINDLLRASVGLNLGMRFLPSALPYGPLVQPQPDPMLCSDIVWFDAFITNVDRTRKNSNLLLWNRELWLIDHGAALYFHHDWRDYLARARTPFAPVRDHVLLHRASRLREADLRARNILRREILAAIVASVPDDWLDDASPFSGPEEHRAGYLEWLSSRLDASSLFVTEAERARSSFI